MSDLLNKISDGLEKLAANKKEFDSKEAVEILTKLGYNIKTLPFPLKDFVVGLNVELEHGTINAYTNVTDDDPILTAKIALAHLNESKNYYKELVKMEKKLEK